MITTDFVLRLIKRWFWLLILAPLVAGVISYQANADTPVYYEARALLQIGPGVENPNPDLNDLRTAGMLLETYAMIAETRPFLEQVIDTLDLEDYSPGKLENRIEIVTNPNSQTMSIRVRELDRTEAMLIANTIATMLVNLSPSGTSSMRLELTSAIEAQINSLRSSIEASELLIEQLEEDLEVASSEADRLRYIEQISAERARIANAERTVATLYESLQEPLTNQVRIIEPAEPGNRINPQIELRASLSSLGGLMIAIALAFTVEYLDDRIYTPQDLATASRLPVLGTLRHSLRQPAMLNRRSEVGRRKARIVPDDGYQLLAFRLRRLRDGDKNTEVRSVLMSGLPGAENVGLNIIHTALALAQTGTRVVLVDADMHNPVITEFFELSDEFGLTDVLGEELQALSPTSSSMFPELKVIPIGRNPAGGLALLCSREMAELIERLKEETDLVIVGISTQESHMESLALGNLVDGTLLLAARNVSRRKTIGERIAEAEALGVNMLGAILIDPPAEEGSSLLRRLRSRLANLGFGRFAVRGLSTETQDMPQLTR
ncbi:MAG: hypothetical protein DIU68_005415 [Chloroflexota bacterium]|nr:MAG: hypothetical protein DIU68_10055 [Chloroflexota bacterium]